MARSKVAKCYLYQDRIDMLNRASRETGMSKSCLMELALDELLIRRFIPVWNDGTSYEGNEDWARAYKHMLTEEYVDADRLARHMKLKGEEYRNFMRMREDIINEICRRWL